MSNAAEAVNVAPTQEDTMDQQAQVAGAEVKDEIEESDAQFLIAELAEETVRTCRQCMRNHDIYRAFDLASDVMRRIEEEGVEHLVDDDVLTALRVLYQRRDEDQ